MKSAGNFLNSSIGRKILMAVSGLVLIGFVIGHLIGNLQVFNGPDRLNGYAAFLHNTGPVLWIARIGVIVALLVHIWAAVVLTLENRAARGPEQYGLKHTIRATLASRTMRLTGLVVLAFLVYHLAHFTWGFAQTDTFKGSLQQVTLGQDYKVAGLVAVEAGAVVDDVYNMVVLGFQSPLVSLFYIIAVGLLSFHLLHGFDSMFQTLGLRSSRWARGLRRASVIFCVVYFLANLTMPVAVLAGKLVPQNPQPAVTQAASVK